MGSDDSFTNKQEIFMKENLWVIADKAKDTFSVKNKTAFSKVCFEGTLSQEMEK